jgi:hypothetical protein
VSAASFRSRATSSFTFAPAFAFSFSDCVLRCSSARES